MLEPKRSLHLDDVDSGGEVLGGERELRQGDAECFLIPLMFCNHTSGGASR
jgi:hypothetical protein